MVGATLALGALIPLIKVDTDPENMLSAEEPVRLFHDQTKRQLDLSDIVVVGIVHNKDPNGVFNPASPARIYELTEFARTPRWPRRGRSPAVEHPLQGQRQPVLGAWRQHLLRRLSQHLLRPVPKQHNHLHRPAIQLLKSGWGRQLRFVRFTTLCDLIYELRLHVFHPWADFLNLLFQSRIRNKLADSRKRRLELGDVTPENCTIAD